MLWVGEVDQGPVVDLVGGVGGRAAAGWVEEHCGRSLWIAAVEDGDPWGEGPPGMGVVDHLQVGVGLG